MEQATGGLDFDPEAVRERYRLERDKRLRENGADQYIEMAGPYARFAEGDPYQVQAILKWDSLASWQNAPKEKVLGDVPNFTAAQPILVTGESKKAVSV